MGKRIASVVIALTLVFSILLSATVSADTISEEKRKLMIAAGEIPPGEITEDNVNIKRDAAIEIAKTMLEDASSYEVGNAYLNPRWGVGGSFWNVDFYKKQTPGGNANVSVDATTGEIFGFNFWDGYDQQQNFIAKMTRSEAREIAEKYLKEKFKLDLSSYELQKENPYEYGYRMGGVKEQVMYNFFYIKKINGVLLSNYSLYVGVDGTNGKVRSYNCNKINIDESQLPSTENAISTEEAMKKYIDSVNVSLQYITSYEEKYYGPAKQKIILAYVPSTYIGMLNAVSGKAINYDGTEIDLSKQEVRDLVENPTPLNPNAKLESKAITEDEAKMLAEKYKAMAEELFGVKFENNQNYYPKSYYYSGQEDIWNFNWYANINNRNVGLNIGISGNTGHIINLNLNNYTYDMPPVDGGKPVEVKEKVTWAQGRDKALEFVKKIAPEYYGFYADLNVEEPAFTEETKKYMREYYYSYGRVVNGLRYRDNNIGVSIDRETGELKNIYFNWSDLDFPSTTGIIPKEEAVKKFFEGTEAKLSYYMRPTYDKEKGQEIFVQPPILIYSFNTKGFNYGNMVIDAVSGKIVDWGGREIRFQSASEEPVISEHWAKRSAELLIAQGIIKDPYIDLDANITKAEAVKMMSLARGMNYYYYDGRPLTTQSFSDVSKDDDYYYFIENAIRHKIITETGGKFKGEEEISGGEFVKLLVNMMGFSEIAKHNEVFSTAGMKNVRSSEKGYAAICYALDVLPVKDGETFDASDKVTCAEAAAALYKALQYIK